jgi:hypothetical protein
MVMQTQAWQVGSLHPGGRLVLLTQQLPGVAITVGVGVAVGPVDVTVGVAVAVDVAGGVGVSVSVAVGVGVAAVNVTFHSIAPTSTDRPVAEFPQPAPSTRHWTAAPLATLKEAAFQVRERICDVVLVTAVAEPVAIATPSSRTTIVALGLHSVPVFLTWTRHSWRPAPAVGGPEGVGKFTSTELGPLVPPIVTNVRNLASGLSGSSWTHATVPEKLVVERMASGE